MVILAIEYRLPTKAVSDFGVWKQVFDTDPVGRSAHGATRHWIHHEAADPNHFLLSLEFASVGQAQAFLDEPMLKQSWEVSGAGQAWVFTETEAVTY